MFRIDHVWWLVFFMFHVISQFFVIFFLKIFVGWKQKDMMEWKFIGFHGYIIVIFQEYNLCSNSKWKIVSSFPFNFFWKGWQFSKFAMRWFDMKLGKKDTQSHSNIWMGNVKVKCFKLFYPTLLSIILGYSIFCYFRLF